ncbi:hypothetical protein C0Q70_13580 [Pomacea canaliculata]|uniref:Uncharacterized protein n=1 Tax=Pomacea canaliculata TaxID=400727 RepID=A0A2T7NXM7_POMCA|nr:hypothetical protein C0Q70_13580 [Pomacea canaliculata]
MFTITLLLVELGQVVVVVVMVYLVVVVVIPFRAESPLATVRTDDGLEVYVGLQCITAWDREREERAAMQRYGIVDIKRSARCISGISLSPPISASGCLVFPLASCRQGGAEMRAMSSRPAVPALSTALYSSLQLSTAPHG